MKSKLPYSPLMLLTRSLTCRSSLGESERAGDVNLNEDPTYPLGVVVQKFGERAQLLNDTLDDV